MSFLEINCTRISLGKKKNQQSYLGKIYELAKPFGRRKLAVVFALLLAQGVMQVVGVTSIFPFLALASDPDRLRNSQFGQKILALLPEMENSELLVATGRGAIVLLLVSNLVNFAAEISRNRYTHLFGHWLRSALIHRIISQPYEYFFTQNTSRLIKIITGDVFTYVNGVLLPLLDSVARALTVLFLAITLFLVHPTIALAASLFFACFYLIVFMLFRRIRDATSDGVLDAGRGTIKETQQLLTGIKPIKAQDSENYFFGRFESHSRKLADLMSWVNVIGNGPRYLVEPLAFGGLVVVVIVLINRGGNFADILPNLGVMALAGYRLLPAIQLIYGQLNQLTSMRYSLEEVHREFFRSPTRSHDLSRNGVAQISWNNAVSLENVTFYYGNESQPILENVTIEFSKGSSIGVMGASGAGKSTLADLVMGLLTPRSGRIRIDGEILDASNVAAWRRHVAYVPQEVFLMDDTVASNIAFGIPKEEIDQAHLVEVCAKAHILEFIQEDLDNGFDSIVGERGIRLSGGQRQRIGLARALYRKPSLLVLDEATSALDSDTELSVVNAIESLKGKMTLLVVAHRLSTLEKCTSWWKVADSRVKVIASLDLDLIES